MKLIFLLIGFFFTLLNAENSNELIFEEFDLIKESTDHFKTPSLFKSYQNSLVNTNEVSPSYGFAINSKWTKSFLPVLKKIKMNELLVQSRNVCLSHGCLKLKKGFYRIQYGVNLQNNGEGGSFVSWVTFQPKHGVAELISTSIAGQHVSPFNFSESYVQINQIFYYKLTETSLVCLNYRTLGNVKLSKCQSLIPFFDHSSESHFFNESPQPFYIIAVKVAEVN